MNFEVDPVIWFTNRELPYPPIHFLTATTPLTPKSKQWVLDNLKSRFSITHNNMSFLLDIDHIGIISFEDPKDLMLYELKWS